MDVLKIAVFRRDKVHCRMTVTSFELSNRRRSFPGSHVGVEANFSCALVRSLLQKTTDIALLNSSQRIGKINFVPCERRCF